MQSVVECAHRGDDFSICRVTRQPKEEEARAVRDITHILVAVAWKPSLADGREQQQAIEPTEIATLGQIERQTCRERVCRYVKISVVGVSLKTKTKDRNNTTQ